ncbi:MAG: sugar transferase [Anaerolineae bacterium]
MMDVLVSALAIVILSPLMIVIALFIRWSSPGTIFFRAERVGKDGKLFKVYKFRSMVMDAHNIGPAITGAQDKRITPIGRWLRRTKLDELPQLFNVLKGEMSLVGPRPEDPRYVQLYSSEQREVLKVRPGITSPASVVYRHEQTLLTGSDWENHYIRTIMPAKLAIDLVYSKQHTFVNDIKILLQTVLALFR